MGWGGVGYLFTRGRGGPLWLEPVPYISCPCSGSHCDPTRIGFWELRRLALLWAVRVGRRALWEFLCCGHGKLKLAYNQEDNEKELGLGGTSETGPGAQAGTVGSRGRGGRAQGL
eukprot:scaffold469_cov142-Isochrysis_galbana.AAC.4